MGIGGINVETLIGIIIAVVIAIGAYLFGRGSNGKRMGRVKSDLDRAGDANRRASGGVRVSRDAVERSVKRNKRVGELLKKGRAILDKARARAKNKNNNLGGG